MDGLLRICVECSGVYGCKNEIIILDCPEMIEDCPNFDDCPIMQSKEPLYTHGLCDGCLSEQLKLLRERRNEKDASKKCKKKFPKSCEAGPIREEKIEEDSIKHSL